MIAGMTLDPAIGILIVVCTALLLASAGTHKLRDIRHFDEIFAAYGVMPSLAKWRLSRLIPFLELGLAAGMLVSSLRPYFGVAVILLLLTYAAAIGINLRRGRREIACGCGGPNDRRPISPWMVWRNILVSLMVAIALSPWSARGLRPMDGVTVVFGLMTISLLYLCVDMLLGDVAGRVGRPSTATYALFSRDPTSRS